MKIKIRGFCFVLAMSAVVIAGPVWSQDVTQAKPEKSGATRIVGLNEAAQNIERALRKTMSQDHFETRFGDVVEEFRTELQFPILLHESARDNNLDADTLITITLRDVSAAAILLNILDVYACTITIQDEVLKVVSNDYANRHPEHRIIDCSEIVRQHFSTIDSGLAAEQLVRAIQQTVDTNSWRVNGGTGDIAMIGSKLIVTQTFRNHKTISELLAALGHD